MKTPHATLHISHLETTVGIRQLGGLGIGFTLGVHGDGSDLLLLHGAVVAAGLGLGDGVDDLFNDS